MAEAQDDPALLLTDFVNTLNIEDGEDELTTPAQLAAWLAGRGLVPDGTGASGAELATATALREGLREAMSEHHGPAHHESAHHGPAQHGPRETDFPEFPDDLDDALAALPLRVALGGTRPRGAPGLVPADPPGTAAAGLARIAAAIMDSVAAGTWPRLKVCQEDTCRWAFLDTSKNRSRSWCSMRVCGNRTKTRAYRARRRA
ncbi:CGNR zinc finger domain-containing protein [Actinomadura sp. 9N215]|uniref:CGNR zinc finger domain-containing protein n=1 Tax=Actinomadura sp. 9N215 TaxID=3375150 RepID=UPI00379FEFAC